ncbi:CRISPR-associated protein, Crm2 family [Sulfolobus islandicus L.S.2.15]|uniref:CRISPR-associated protein, Crm2 family n=1 Tax=Saccharolobus islandicus (strain L.S.2.15 / Lassen \|nr:type III-B CRISPR-associated protein Cas10/Cmr2 [Sulfolobus islandicus]ACP34879.1 CRISPR-associated protein, Crm2 family [Sulfolobus islandicus L.S.2.15]
MPKKSSSSEIGVNEFIRYKVAAILHDPPNKARIISEGHHLHISHEAEAYRIASHLSCVFPKIDSLVDKYVKNRYVDMADRLASSIDRYLGSIVYGKNSLFRENNIYLKNILQPSLYLNVSNLCFPLFSKGNYGQQFINSLIKLLSKLTPNLMLPYQIFYLIYELLWIDLPYSTGPADTRNPTHTIFDHLYATATMMNWILTFKGQGGYRRKAYLLGIDTVGVTDFISKGRKTRDLWISSYLVSSLLWYVLTLFIEEYGPDVVIFPSLRFNQFYAFYILEKLRRERIDEDIINEIRDLVTKYIFNDDKLFEKMRIPPYPIIPGRVTLILPGFKRDGDKYTSITKKARNYFVSMVKRKFDEAWKKLVNALKLYSSLRKEDGFWNLVCNVLTKTEDIVSIPPLKIRVRQVDVEKSEIFNNDDLSPDSWKVYDKKYRQLVSEFKKDKLIKVTPESHLKLFRLTKDGNLPQFGERSKRGYEFCTSCGVLPAVVIMPSEEGFEEKVVNMGLAKDENDAKKLRKLISPGERLCPWCLVKRALGTEPRLLRVLLLGDLYDLNEIVNQILEESNETEIPSTSDIASIYIFEELIKKKDEICKEDGPIQDFCNNSDKNRVSMWDWFNKNMDKGINLSVNPEDHWFNEDMRPYYRSLFRHYGIAFPSPYYALVKADSDYLGDLFEGKLTPYLSGIIDSGDYANINEKKDEVRKILNFYLSNAGSGEIIDYVRSIITAFLEDNDYTKALRMMSEHIKDHSKCYEQFISSKKYFSEIFKEGRIIVTPAWHVSISAALNRGLLAELNLINKHKGFVIYAGGDDLLAMLPVKEVLDFIKESRRAFAGSYNEKLSNMCLENGFVRFNNAYYPSLPVVGRSYSVIIAHYADPLSMVVNDSYNLLEEGKEMIKYKAKYEDEFKYVKKDVAIFRYQGLTSVIPLSLKRPIVSSTSDFSYIASILDLISDLKEKIDKGKISTSLLYDYENYKDLIILGKEYESFVNQVIKYWIKRNSQRREGAGVNFDNELFDVSFKVCNEFVKIPQDLISNIVYTLRIIYGGVK